MHQMPGVKLVTYIRCEHPAPVVMLAQHAGAVGASAERCAKDDDDAVDADAAQRDAVPDVYRVQRAHCGIAFEASTPSKLLSDGSMARIEQPVNYLWEGRTLEWMSSCVKTMKHFFEMDLISSISPRYSSRFLFCSPHIVNHVVYDWRHRSKLDHLFFD